MKRFIFFIAFLCIASSAPAQSAEALRSLQRQDVYAVVPGATLPRDPASAEATPVVLLFSILSPLHAAEAVTLAVAGAEIVDSMRSDSGYDEGSSQPGRSAAKRNLPLRRSRARNGFIFRHY